MKLIVVLLVVVVLQVCVVPVLGLGVEYLASNVSLITASNFVEPGWAGGSTEIAGRSIVEWLDGAPGQPRNVWSCYGAHHNYVAGSVGDGPCLDAVGSYAAAWTAVPGSSLAFVLGCDWNDGRGELYVDNALVARLEWRTADWTNYAVVVDSLPYSTHNLRLTCIQKYPQDLTTDVFIYGAAVLAPVPEPSSLLTLLGGLGTLCGMICRRKR